MKVLLLDDDDGVRSATVKLLERAGFSATAVADPASAFTALANQSYDAVVCDVILQETEGTAFYEELCERFPAMSERVVFVTGWAADDEKTRALVEFTGRPFLEKPFESAELIALLQGLGLRT